MSLDDLDLTILRELQKDARISHRALARKLNIATGTVLHRIEKLMDKGILKGFEPVIDLEKIGYDLTTLTLVRVKGGHLREVGKYLAEFDNVVCVYDITGEYDVAIVSKSKGRKDLDEFLKTIHTHDWVERTVTSLVLNVIKEDFKNILIPTEKFERPYVRDPFLF